MKKYTFEDFVKGNIAVTFENIEEVKTFLDKCIKNNLLNSKFKSACLEWIKNSNFKLGLFVDKKSHKLKAARLENLLFEKVAFKNITFKKSSCEIHITVKNNETHAILKENGKVVKREVSKCHHDDKFDFTIGATMTFNRLFDKDEKIDVSETKDANFLNCSFEVLTDSSILTKGKIYDVVDGYFTADNNAKYPKYIAPLKFFEDLENYLRRYSIACHKEKTIKVKQVKKKNKRPAKMGEYVMITNNRFCPSLKIGSIKKIQNELCNILVDNKLLSLNKNNYIVLEGYESAKAKVLALKGILDKIYPQKNILGTPVLSKDVKGSRLHIGDIVKVFDKYNNFKQYAIVTCSAYSGFGNNINNSILFSANGTNSDGRWFVLNTKYSEFNLNDEISVDNISDTLKVVEIEKDNNT
ncbi:hypothetical protein CWE04_11265 [Thomasclavelia cocleata]|uniref:Uncharacterized protein n=1 Tax=Thomasclavelia cocleata TaxID=69824 RepID=A0A1I0BGY7_9FIRM|nr:hypothetical protein [Thomasclavelia cocleata]MCR1959893.1 hypothetical protein [Thomasclavelia cocleata]NDO41761.1 hypothetical protein [Thomasclavelia cocleata]PJN79788.1 hypothetical protein CWE04_11265 [Thomasclavelia cocleata]SET05469.1 hypothetical protein SAMN04489758_10199 [Thomasclavelia cocleata]